MYSAFHPLAIWSPLGHTCQTMSTKKSELWQRLRAARQASGLTQQVIADACGVSRTAVALWTSQDPDTRTTPSIPHLRSFAELTGVPMDWLLSDMSSPTEAYKYVVESADAGDTVGRPTNGTPVSKPNGSATGVLPDIRQGDHVFCFAETPDQVAAKLQQLALDPAPKKHLIVLNSSVEISTAADASAALSVVISKLT